MNFVFFSFIPLHILFVCAWSISSSSSSSSNNSSSSSNSSSSNSSSSNSSSSSSSGDLFLSSDGPFAVVTDVKRGTICSTQEDLLMTDIPLPPECGCNFYRLKTREERCAAYSIGNESEKEECNKNFCELCCTIQVSKIQNPGEDRTHLQCMKKCSRTDEGEMHGPEDMADHILTALMEYVESFYIREEELPFLGIPSRLETPQAVAAAAAATEEAATAASTAAPSAAATTTPAPVAPAAAPAMHAHAAPQSHVIYRPTPPITAIYPLTRLPSEEEAAAAAAKMGNAAFINK